MVPGPQGPEGPQGEPGPQGQPGTPGGSQFVFTQSSPVDTWIVNHNLGYLPHTTIILDDGFTIISDVEHTSINSLTIYFAAPQTGKAVCS